ncbi:protein SODIUM POTASSIUM ROOT DEFECTIVE 3 isoform X2 [Raphanus sativus]|uniref:Protein SODIUM POTASSIUM ROOT DEFECTIVE 3 isoform X2 n=1 Tax=Raphanus sativus TaxID=3726 RepID=A0A6J0KGB9_RAPSA|nr:protein SODIUM POTASSIUM ROOT DEFECTIVE 3 isoform X2 [Raphanus sativus]
MFCASQASTATASHDERSAAARAIDRHNPIIKDGRRSFTAPCSSGDDYIAPYRQISKITRIPSSSGEGKMIPVVEKGRKSSSGSLLKLSDNISLARKSFGCVAGPACAVTESTPPGSTRYLLGSEPVSSSKDAVVTEEGEPSLPKGGSAAAVEEKKKTFSGLDQVVVLRVSLHCHCRGCQGKVKKHLSRMQGVTSFSIDFASKKVTVTGDVTPLEVLGCLSKVKNAQFWTPPPPPSSSLTSANPEN